MARGGTLFFSQDFQQKLDGDKKYGSVINDGAGSHSGDTGQTYDNIRVLLGRSAAGHGEKDNFGLLVRIKKL